MVVNLSVIVITLPDTASLPHLCSWWYYYSDVPILFIKGNFLDLCNCLLSLLGLTLFETRFFKQEDLMNQYCPFKLFIADSGYWARKTKKQKQWILLTMLIDNFLYWLDSLKKRAVLPLLMMMAFSAIRDDEEAMHFVLFFALVID